MQQHILCQSTACVFSPSLKPVNHRFIRFWFIRRVLPSLAGLPAADGHLKHPVGGEHGGGQRQVGHGAGAVLGADPALDRLTLIGEAICPDNIHTPNHSERI